MQVTSVAEYADVLRNPDLKLYEDGWYTSKTTGKRGYRATFSLGREWYWYSVSDTAVKLSPLEVADAITSPSAEINRSGAHKEKGFEATVRFEEHSYMLNAGDSKPGSLYRLATLRLS
jgi:hypothetical protein